MVKFFYPVDFDVRSKGGGIRKHIARALLISSSILMLSGCPPVVRFEVCNNLGFEIVLHDGRTYKILPENSGHYMIPPMYLTKGTEIQLSIEGIKKKYYLKITGNQFYEASAFGGRIKAQINPDKALYLMQKESLCPEKISDQPQGFPVYGTDEDVSNNEVAAGNLFTPRTT